MKYIIIEDSTDGFSLCEKICEIYNSSNDIIHSESSHGVTNLEAKISDIDKRLNDNDTVYIVYDDITENKIVSDSLLAVKEYLSTSKRRKQFHFIKTISFELEILMIKDIEYFTNISQYLTYVTDIRELYSTYHDTSTLTEFTKDTELYDTIYNKIRKEKRNRWEYAKMSDDDFERCITIESLSKELLKEVFRNHAIDRPLTDCWVKPCCKRRNRCKLTLIDTKLIEKEQTDKNDNNVKLNIIISNTSYKNLAKVIGNGDILKYDINTFIDKKALEANCTRQQII
ncbi:MAG: hypothetical protein NC548_47090 [Lachnospiraceae bacterium]|nr:hypothetical protein [Lachnospiraceae bacterium]